MDGVYSTCAEQWILVKCDNISRSTYRTNITTSHSSSAYRTYAILFKYIKVGDNIRWIFVSIPPFPEEEYH